MKDKFQSKAVPRGTRTIWRYLSALILLFYLSIGQMWGADVTIFSANFSDAVWASHATICNGSTAEETVEGILFRSNNSSKNYSVADGALTFCNNNIGDNYYFLIHLEDVNGSVHVSFGTVSNSQRINYKWFEQTARPTSSSSSTSTAASINTNREIALDYSMTGSGSDLWLMVGRQGSGQTTVIKTITITTPAAADVAPAITAPTTDQSASYTVGDAITALSVTATGTPTPTYQWYSNASASTTGATLITGAESASYTPSNAEASDLYYYCVATNSKGSAQSPYFHVTVSAAVATAPSFTSPASEPAVAEYSVGDAISALEVVAAGYPAPTLQWYSNSSKSTEGATLITGAESASYTPSNAAVSDLYFYCVATNASGTAQSEYFHVTVAAVSYCAELYPATSGASPTGKNQELLLQSEAPNASYGGKIYTAGAKDNNWSASFTYTANGLQLNKGGADSARVELNHLMQVGTVITATLVNPDDSKARGYKLLNMSKTAKATWQAQTTEPQVYTYTVVAGDGLAGTNMFLLNRAESSALKELKVSNCGDELFELSSAVDPAGEATVTLSNNLLVAGGSATATYTISNPLAYDFDEWEITSGDATIADIHAATAAITMGTSAATITLKLKEASVKHTVTYYDGEAIPENKLGEELVEHNAHPTGAGLAPHKLGYTFGGWSTTEGGAAATLSDINVTADMPLYAVWNAVNCATKSGTIYTMSIAVAPAANCTIKTAEGYSATWDLYQYNGVSGGEATIGNTGGSNNCILQTNKTILLKDEYSYLKLDFDCPLKEGDKIRSNVTGAGKAAFISTESTRPEESGALAIISNSATGEIAVPAALDGATSIYIWKGGGNVTITSINIYRPAHFAVTFNMHGHGDAVAEQSVVEGGKVTKPTDPTASGWDFGGWFTDDTYGTTWDFENMTISAATEIHAKWTEHTTSSDATLSSLSYTIGGGEPIAIPLVADQYAYAVELPMGTDIDAPVIAAVANDPNAKALDIVQTNLGIATVTVTAEDNSTIQSYAITFSVATSKAIQLVFKTGTTPCVGSASTATQILSNNAAVSTYINQITFTNVEGAGDNGAEGSSLNVGKKAGNMFTLSAKPGFAFQAMNFLAKIQDATCEYSINGGAWTELASTNTGGDECYAPFTSGTVHEFRLRSTGASGVWIRNMQLTIVEACTPVAITWDEEPVEFEVGKAGYAIAATANNGGTIAYGSSDASIISVDAGNGVLSISDLGSVTLSASTAEGDGTTFCENGGADIVLSKVVNTYHLITLNALNGDAPAEIKFHNGDAAIAEPAEPIYAGHTFQGWLDEMDAPVVWPLTPTASLTFHASWTDDCTAPTIDVQPASANYFTGRTAAALNCEATAAGGNALTYTWYSCDDELKTNPVELSGVPTPSTAAAGTSYFFCAVTEEGCANVAYSNVAVITVSDKDPICLVKAELAPGSSAASITSTSGYYKDDANIAINIKKDLKLGSTGNYVKVAIDGANFQDGDVVEITLASDKTASAWLQIFTDEGTTMVAEMTSGVSREHPNYLTISGVPANTKTLYLYRTEAADGNMNPYPTSMAVYRTCAPILNKVTVAGVDGTPDNTNHVAMEVPFSTLDAALDAIAYDWVSNDAAWTAAHEPAVANAWEWGVENTVTLTDKDNDQSVYYVTISKAAASTDATLSALSASAGDLNPAFDPAVLSYIVELPYGTSEVPTLSATKNHIGAAEPVIVDAASFTNRQAVSTVTVTAEDETTELTYTVTFRVERFPSTVIWDGSTMSAVAESPASGFTWAVTGFGDVANYNATCGAKAYTKCLPSGGSASATRNFALNVPEGYLAKFHIVFGTHSDGNKRGMFIASNVTKKLEEATSVVLTLYSDSRMNLTSGRSEMVLGEGTWYINPMESVDFYEISATLMPVGYQRSVTEGRMGTVCLPANVEAGYIYGAEVYTLLFWKYGSSYADCQMVDFGEVTEMQEGYPYLIIPTSDKFAVVYGDKSYDGAGVHMDNGFIGTINAIAAAPDNVLVGKYGIINNMVQKLGTNCNSPANRAYIDLSDTPSKEEYEAAHPNPAPRKRVSLGHQGTQVTTGLDAINVNTEKIEKVMIDGQMFIIRGGHIFDATGRLVK